VGNNFAYDISGGNAGRAITVGTNTSRIASSSGTLVPGAGGGGSGCSGPGTFDLNELFYLRNQCSIHLGDSEIGALKATVPRDFVPTLSKTEMKWAEGYMDQWMKAVVPSDADWETANNCIDYSNSDHTPGLFWDDGWGFYHRALLHAVLTLRAYSHLTTSPSRFAQACGNYSADDLQDQINNRSRWIHTSPNVGNISRHAELGCDPNPELLISIDVDGRVSATRKRDGFNAFAYVGNIYFCNSMRLEAALADYYLYWAHRLYCYFWEESNDLSHWYIGLLCARAGLSEICELASLILHEYLHIVGSSYHCDQFFGSKEDCCQYILENIFRNRISAELGVPFAQLYNAAKKDWSNNRFYFIGDPWEARAGSGENCVGSHVWGRHSSLLDRKHMVSCDWYVVDKCSTGASSGTITFNNEDAGTEDPEDRLDELKDRLREPPLTHE
jgi:hypothetical protein